MDAERFDTFVLAMRKDLPAHLREIEEEAIRDHVPILRPAGRDLLSFLVRMKQPERILEIGTGTGFSALLMQEAQPETGIIVTMEKDPERIRAAEEHFQKYDQKQRIRLVTGDAAGNLDALLAAFRDGREAGFDLIFIDAAKGQYPVYLAAAKELLVPGGLMVFDNVLQEETLLSSRYQVARRERTIHARMREMVKELMEDETFQTFLTEAGDGMCVSYKI